MIRALYRTESGELHRDLNLQALRASLKSQTGLLWIDLDTGDPNGRLMLHDDFGFHPLAIDDCYNGRVDTPKIDDYDTYLFIVAQSVAYSLHSQQLGLTELGLFLGSNYVVSVHQSPIAPVEDLFKRASGSVYLLNRGADFLAHTILDEMVDAILPAVEEMDERLDDLERAILERPEKHLLGDVLRLKRDTLRLRRSILPQRDMVNRLSRGEFALIHIDALIFYRDIYDHIVRIESMLEGLRDLADGALSSYLSAVNNRMNEIMKVLSVVAVIFLPLTLIASIYGTNLDFSTFGLEYEHGFALMLAGMVLIAAAMVLFFHKRGWF